MNGQTDVELLREYAEQGEESAFGQLVHRHVDLVYSAALRIVRDPHLAEDVTQGVFLALARAAGQLRDRPVLSGWLHRTTQNLAANTVRSDVRRRAREQEAAAMIEPISVEAAPGWEEVAPHLDAGLGELNEPDRDALLLRYFERKSAREMAYALGTSEEAAQKRVSRAVERLRDVLLKRGVTVGAEGLAVLISAHAIEAAPAGLALTITTTAGLAGAAAVALTTSTAAKTIAMTTLQKGVIASAFVAIIGVGTYQTRQASLLRAQVETLHKQLSSQPASAPDSALTSLQKQVDSLEAQKAELNAKLARANSEKAQVTSEREQARRSAALYKELVDQAGSKDANATNAYPTPRHVWTAFGRLGRLAALAKQQDSNLSPEEKSALDAARTAALEELPTLLKAAKQLDDGKPGGSDVGSEEVMDDIACLLYGALKLDQQQFNEVYAVMQNLQLQSKGLGNLKELPAPEAADAIKEFMDKFKTDLQPVLTPEQSRIFADVVTHIQVQPGSFGFNFNF